MHCWVSFSGFAEVMFEFWMDRCDQAMLAMMKGNGVSENNLTYPSYNFLLLGNNFCPELTRKHVSNAYYNAELESELEENCQKSITFFRSDQDKNRVMAEIEEHRASKPYVHHQTDMCLHKGILYLYDVSLLHS